MRLLSGRNGFRSHVLITAPASLQHGARHSAREFVNDSWAEMIFGVLKPSEPSFAGSS
jgi:hypothetical protein